MEEYVKRKTPRLQNFDYSSCGAYFITICTENRRCILSNIVGTGVPDCPCVQLTKYGEIAEKYIKQLDAFYDHISIDSYVIMPNHIHIMLFIHSNGQLNEIQENGQSRTPVPTKANSVYSQFISTFKRFCNKEYGVNIWQSRSYDHVIRDRRDYDEHTKYIYENPIRWQYDKLYSDLIES